MQKVMLNNSVEASILELGGFQGITFIVRGVVL
jgi:hypothetical protein